MLGPNRQLHRTVRSLVIVATVAAMLTIWQHVASARKHVSFPQQIARILLRPLQSSLMALRVGLSESAASLRSSHSLQEEVRKLQEKVDELQVKNLQLNESFLEYKRIIEKLGFPLDKPLKEVPVRVIGTSGGGHRAWVRIEAPPTRELQPGDIVCEKRGVVGRILEVEAKNVAKVVLLIDREHALAAKVLRSGDQGMIYPAPTALGTPDKLEMKKLPRNADIRAGDVILTSGLGGVYPPNLPIGTVLYVKTGSGTSGVVAVVKPFVDFERLDWLYVMRRE